MGAKGQGGAFPPAVLGGLLAQAYLISWEAFAGPVPAEARVQLLPGHVVLGGLEEELEWPLLGWEDSDLATRKFTFSWSDPGTCTLLPRHGFCFHEDQESLWRRVTGMMPSWMH